jgi:hypothetical protein
VPLFVRCGAVAVAVAAVLGVVRTTGGAGVEATGCEGAGRDDERASKSER